jgi:hypothetical protein
MVRHTAQEVDDTGDLHLETINEEISLKEELKILSWEL